MRREQSLRRRADFDAVYRLGRIESNRMLVVRTRSNGLPLSRFAFVVPSRAFPKAVDRNRIKRRLRSACDAIAPAPGLDIIVATRRSASELSFAELSRSLTTLLRRAGALAD